MPPLACPPARPYAFLVSTTGCARSIRENLGSAAYSYYFVLEALAPVLERFGTWRLVDRPASSLAFAARRAEAEGYRPVHLAINPLQDLYATPDVPTIAFPFWEFPDLPGRDFDHDTRQNWHRTARGADLILSACRFTAESFRRAGVRAPVAVVAVPLEPGFFDLPDWDPSHSWTIHCRHEVWGGGPTAERPEGGPTTIEETTPYDHRTLRRRAWLLARGGFRKVAPRLSPDTVDRISRAKRRVLGLRGESPRKVAFLAARAGYRRLVRRWLSPGAISRVTRIKERGLALAGRSPRAAIDPLLPRSPLTLSGLVYTMIFNLGDRRKNYADALAAFLIAFRDRPDATLVLKLATSPHREHHELSVLRAAYRGLGLGHRCRVVVVTDYLDEAALSGLFRATTYYVNTSHAEGACLPLQRALAGGRPAIAPRHTAMADYIDDEVAFEIGSHPEPAPWPHDPEQRLETSRYRIVWSDVHRAFLESAATAETDPARYAAMASAARRRMAGLASREVVADALADALARLPDRPSASRRAG